MVSEMLGDSKLEVREVAAVTLAGLLKGAAPPEARQLRESFQADVARFSRRRRRRTATGAAAAGTETLPLCAGLCQITSYLSDTLYPIVGLPSLAQRLTPSRAHHCPEVMPADPRDMDAFTLTNA